MPPPTTSGITPEWWWARIEGKKAVALRMVDSREHCREAWMAAGTAVEFGLKAVIMKREPLDRWPDKDARPDLHVHDLYLLAKLAGIDPRTLPRPLYASFKTVLDWERSHGYTIARMERRVARSMVESAFGADGVVPWLKTL